MSLSPKYLENDALVVLCLRDTQDTMTHHEFKVRAANRGFSITRTDCHNMLHRAMGRVRLNGYNQWKLTSMGLAYRQHVLESLHQILLSEVSSKVA